MRESIYSFADDYSEGAHPSILQALSATNLSQQVAYGDDEYTEQAKHFIEVKIGAGSLDIHFVSGGTLANILCISACLKPHEAVISAGTGHIELREAGAIEATGHKILVAPSHMGKLATCDLQDVLEKNAHFPHMVKPRLVYISNSTEAGTIYTKAELQEISEFCRDRDLFLMVDGARLGSALAARASDLTLQDVAKLSDIFWIGGTKAGALCGEAIIICNKKLAEDFSIRVKQRGALLSKSRVFGIQFSELFRGELFFELSAHANDAARRLSEGLVEAGFPLATETYTNQVFPVLPNVLIESLKQEFRFSVWDRYDEQSSVLRLVTSWATNLWQVEAFVRLCGNPRS